MSAWLPCAVLPLIAVWCWLRRLGIGAGAERIALATGFGVALSSATYFTARWVGVHPVWYRPLECMLVIGLLITGLGERARAHHRAEQGIRADPCTRRDGVIVVAFGAMVVLAGLIVWQNVVSHPHGSWDAWGIWNARAAYLAYPSGAWRHAFDPVLAASHPDYPLLLPGAVARAWVFAGVPASWIPAAIAVAFTAAIVAVVAGGLWRLRGPAWAFAGVGLLLTPELLFQGSTQNADVPLAFFALVAVVLTTRAPRSSGPIILAGVACGCAAWTKNEGLIVATVWPALVISTTALQEGRHAAASVAADLAIGAGPFLVLLALFKIWLAPPNDLVSGLSAPGAFGYWADGVRVSLVAREMALGLVAWGRWPGMVSPVIVLAVLGLLARTRGAAPSMVDAAGLLLLVQVLVFFFVYVMTPYSVAYHIHTSWPRLVTQLWPSLVWWACLGAAPRVGPGSAGPCAGHRVRTSLFGS